jgi:hypothetical protein
MAAGAAAHCGGRSTRFRSSLAASVGGGDQRELLIKIGAVTRAANGRLTAANEGLKFFAARAAAVSKDRHDYSRRDSLTVGMCLSQWVKGKCDRAGYWDAGKTMQWCSQFGPYQAGCLASSKSRVHVSRLLSQSVAVYLCRE